ncbi:AbrB family transcriptional regulator [Gordoniibacillus kamchatkensis]|uniref:AbrB family transcriptional regulator n=1 Tax=Gordoniibacillus kamchatkensis TaxID=1590651 RepID=UPI000A637CF4|nr:AbrB family transcriptional regulator [Paenibacillus sp. VKM B-2647]
MLKSVILTCLAALAGVFVFTLIHMPIPWLLGPMIAVLIGNKLLKLPLAWPGYIRDVGILLVGYSMGLSLTKSALAEVVRELPSMLLMTVLLMTLCTVIAIVSSKLSGIDFPTMMTASVPGGLTQMITLAEEFTHIDLTVVTFFQVIRVMMIVFCVPLLLFSPLLGGEHAAAAAAQAAHAPQLAWGAFLLKFVLFMAICAASAWAGKKNQAADRLYARADDRNGCG